MNKGSRLRADEAVLLVVDLQERLLPQIHELPRLLAATRLMLRAAAVLELPVLTTTQYVKGLGPIPSDLTDLAPGAPSFDKLTFSCFGSPDFRRALSATKRKSVLLCGIETHICVLQTGLDALAEGYEVHLVTDATSARSVLNAGLGERRLERAGAVMSSSEMVIHELLVQAGSPAFKTLLPYLK